MIIGFEKDTKKVIWYNLVQTKEEAEHRLDDTTIWIEGNLPVTESKEGYDVVFCVNEDMQSIRVVYEPISEPEPSQLDIIEKEVKKKNTEIAKAAIDNYTLELVKEGVL